MTMEGMNAYLKDRGFDVHRERDSKRDCYVFTIRKPGYEALTKDFKYPKSDDWNYKNAVMKDFLNGMVRDFYKGEKKDMNSIMWKVEEYEVHHPSPTAMPSIEVSLTGYIDNWSAVTSQSVTKIMQRVEDELNRDAIKEYCRNDIESTKRTYNYVSKTPRFGRLPEITNVIFNDPATIVFWADGTKTVVKCQEGYEFDPMAGLSMAVCEKAFGSKANSHKVFNKWLPKEDEPILYPKITIENEKLAKAIKNVTDECHKLFDSYIDNKRRAFGWEEI